MDTDRNTDWDRDRDRDRVWITVWIRLTNGLYHHHTHSNWNKHSLWNGKSDNYIFRNRNTDTLLHTLYVCHSLDVHRNHCISFRHTLRNRLNVQNTKSHSNTNRG